MKNSRPPSLLLSPPSGGKTSGMRTIKPELAARTLHINCDNKALPWIDPAGPKFQHFTAKCPTLIPSIIKQAAATGKFDLIIVDTITIAMGEFTRRFINSTTPKVVTNDDGTVISDMNYVATTKTGQVDSMGGWGRYGTLVLDIIAECTAADAQVVVMGHLDDKPDEAGNYTFKCPLQGAVGKSGLEGLFSIVMHAKPMKLSKLQGDYAQDHEYLGTEESIEFTGERYVYQVAHTKDTINTHALRTIDGLWPKGVRFVDNDLQMIFDRFETVYGA